MIGGVCLELLIQAIREAGGSRFIDPEWLVETEIDCVLEAE